MFDVLGKVELKSSITNPKSRINIGLLNKGIYFVRLLEGDGNVVYSQKLVKE